MTSRENFSSNQPHFESHGGNQHFEHVEHGNYGNYGSYGGTHFEQHGNTSHIINHYNNPNAYHYRGHFDVNSWGGSAYYGGSWYGGYPFWWWWIDSYPSDYYFYDNQYYYYYSPYYNSIIYSEYVPEHLAALPYNYNHILPNNLDSNSVIEQMDFQTVTNSNYFYILLTLILLYLFIYL